MRRSAGTTSTTSRGTACWARSGIRHGRPAHKWLMSAARMWRQWECLAALLKRQQTGDGRKYIDVALSEAAMPFAMAAWVEAMTPASGRVFHQPARRERLLQCLPQRRRAPACAGRDRGEVLGEFLHRGRDKPEWIDAAYYSATNSPRFDARRLPRSSRPRQPSEWAALLGEVDCCFTPRHRA